MLGLLSWNQFSINIRLFSLIDFVTHEVLYSTGTNSIDLRVPLKNRSIYTFFMAFLREFGSSIEKTIKKNVHVAICQRSYLGKFLLSCCVPECFWKYHRPRLTIWWSILTLTIEFSNMVGSYSLGNLLLEYLYESKLHLSSIEVLPTAPSPTMTNLTDIVSMKK